MIVSKLSIVISTVGLAGVTVFCFLQSQSVDWGAHDRYTKALLRVEGVNADLNKNILKVRYQLLEYYDTLVSELAMLKNLPRTLADIPPTIEATGQREIKQSFDILVGLIDEKGTLLERFKSKNAVLKNSVRYLPAAIQEAREELKDKNLGGALEGLFWDIQQYTTVPSEALERKIQTHVKQLTTSSGRLPSVAARDAMERVLAHVRTVLEHTPVVNSLTANLTWLPIGQWSNTLSQTYEQHHDHAVAQAERFRLFFYGSAAAFLFYTLGLMLWQARQLRLARTTMPSRAHEAGYWPPAAPPRVPDVLESHRAGRLTNVERNGGHADRVAED